MFCMCMQWNEVHTEATPLSQVLVSESPFVLVRRLLFVNSVELAWVTTLLYWQSSTMDAEGEAAASPPDAAMAASQPQLATADSSAADEMRVFLVSLPPQDSSRRLIVTDINRSMCRKNQSQVCHLMQLPTMRPQISKTLASPVQISSSDSMDMSFDEQDVSSSSEQVVWSSVDVQ